jgi:hypothetical protein
MIVNAHCFKSGEIVISETYDITGMIRFATAEKHILESVLARIGRLSYSDEWLVPGLPEAETEADAVTALAVFQAAFEHRMSTHSVSL